MAILAKMAYLAKMAIKRQIIKKIQMIWQRGPLDSGYFGKNDGNSD